MAGSATRTLYPTRVITRLRRKGPRRSKGLSVFAIENGGVVTIDLNADLPVRNASLDLLSHPLAQ